MKRNSLLVGNANGEGAVPFYEVVAKRIELETDAGNEARGRSCRRRDAARDDVAGRHLVPP
jgi:hypothetical protein